MHVGTTLLCVWLGSAFAMTLGWMWQRSRHNAGIVDVIWSTCLAAAAVFIAAVSDGAPIPRALCGILGGLWGGRLALHLWRRVRAEKEDGRYRYLREHWEGDQRKFFAFFQFQALLVVLFALPFLAASGNHTNELTLWTVLAVSIWVVSVGGEWLADSQLARFRADSRNRGRTCREGLWRYSRHPNYFFEWLHWWTYVALSIGSPLAGLALAGPLVMYVFLRWLSGIPFTEAQALRTRGEDYKAYQKQTSMLFPWFPARETAPEEKRTA
jgi:steroid 5-alpha reductase family enzyme